MPERVPAGGPFDSAFVDYEPPRRRFTDTIDEALPAEVEPFSFVPLSGRWETCPGPTGSPPDRPAWRRA